jgi:hypothetical protein
VPVFKGKKARNFHFVYGELYVVCVL